MMAIAQRAESMVGRPARLLGLAVLVVVFLAMLLVSVALVAMGPSELKAFVAVRLDDMHLSGPRTELLRAAKSIERANAVEDARVALASGDSRLVPVMGIGEAFPRVPDDEFARYHQRYGAKPPLYAGCVIESAEDDRFRTAAYDYAEKYNRAVLAQVQQ